MDIILYEMKIEGFHKLSLRFFRLAVSLISSQLVLELYSSRILFYYEMKIGEWFHEFKIFWLAVSFVLLPSWVLSCMRWKLEMIPRVKFKIFRWTGSVHSSWRKIGRFQELNLRFLDWQWVSCCFLRGYLIRNENWRIPRVEFKIF